MINMQLSKSRVLTQLAISPNGRATVTDLEQHLRDNAVTYEAEHPVVDQLLHDIDLIEAGLIVSDGESLQITDAGRDVANAIERYRDQLPDHGKAPGTEALELIDHLIGPEVRSKIFDLELRGADGDSVQSSPEEDRRQLSRPTASPQSLHVATPDPRDEANSPVPAPIEHPPQIRPDPPKSARGVSSDNTAEPSRQERTLRGHAGPTVRGKLHHLGMLWRRHLEQDLPKSPPTSPSRGLNGAIVALISLLAMIICAGAVIALTQIRLLKMEISSLQRELSPLKERLLRLDQAEKAKEAGEAKARDERDKASPAIQPQPTSLGLSREETQLIRDYIKPAPVSGPSAASVNVGDPVAWPTIPFPSPVTEKVPKLLGARFAIRNGSILVVRRDSRQVNAILAPN